MSTVKLNTAYQVAKNDVKLTIVIGEGQVGVSLVMLDNKQIEKSEAGNFYNVGAGPDIAGSVLLVISEVQDTNPNINRTSISYILDGGKVEKPPYKLNADVGEEGKSITYRAEFELFN